MTAAVQVWLHVPQVDVELELGVEAVDTATELGSPQALIATAAKTSANPRATIR